MISKEKLLLKLNWFYSLELNQVDLYKAQSKLVEEIYLQKILERVAEIEQGHVDNLANKIIQLGGTPTRIGEIIGPITGKIAGTITGNAGVVNMLKANITLEEKAMKDYKDAILECSIDKGLFDLMWTHLVDEDLHTAWFASKLAEIQNKPL